VLRDGDGAEGAGDNYKVTFSANESCFVYVVQVDASGKIDRLFPGPYVAESNPVTAKKSYSLPEGANWFYLDRNKGVETVYFFGSRERNVKLEELLDAIEKNRPVGPIALRIDRPIAVTRGVEGVRPGKARPVELPNGSTVSFSPSSFLVPAKASEVVLTRWFHHR